MGYIAIVMINMMVFLVVMIGRKEDDDTMVPEDDGVDSLTGLFVNILILVNTDDLIADAI